MAVSGPSSPHSPLPRIADQTHREQRFERRLWSTPKRITKEIPGFPHSFENRIRHRDMAPEATIRCFEAHSGGAVCHGRSISTVVGLRHTRLALTGKESDKVRKYMAERNGVRTVQEFMEFVWAHPKTEAAARRIFRGQRNDWPLLPSCSVATFPTKVSSFWRTRSSANSNDDASISYLPCRTEFSSC